MAGEITDDLLKSLHKPLKAWYKGAPDPEGEGLMLAKRLGRFPMFFQDLRKWEGFKEAYKLYLASIESAEKKEADREIAAKRKRSRWHDLEGAAAKAAAAAEVETEQEEKPKKRRSRWAREPSKDVEVTFKTLPSGLKIPAFLTPEKQIEFLLKLRLDRCNQQLANVEHIAANAANDPNRSPSPEPIYNSNGKRINKRIDRMRGKLIHERTSIVAELIKCNPALKGMAPKIKRKLYIPQKQVRHFTCLLGRDELDRISAGKRTKLTLDSCTWHLAPPLIRPPSLLATVPKVQLHWHRPWPSWHDAEADGAGDGDQNIDPRQG